MHFAQAGAVATVDALKLDGTRRRIQINRTAGEAAAEHSHAAELATVSPGDILEEEEVLQYQTAYAAKTMANRRGFK